MLRFYWPLLRATPGIALRAADGAFTGVAILIGGVAFFNRELARHWTNWDGFCPWWALLPFGLLLVYGIVRANYEHYKLLAGAAPGSGLHVETPTGVKIQAPDFKAGDSLSIGESVGKTTIRHSRPEKDKERERVDDD
jgi:hypothetical protein